MNEELNRKLAEWAGFRRHRFQYTDGRPPSDWTWEWFDDKEIIDLPELPNFTESLDACFKWLVPKVSRLYLYRPAGETPITVRVNGNYTGEADTPALALCLAIEKLIDKD